MKLGVKHPDSHIKLEHIPNAKKYLKDTTGEKVKSS